MPFCGIPRSCWLTSSAPSSAAVAAAALALADDDQHRDDDEGQEGSGAAELDQALAALRGAGLALFAQTLFATRLSVAAPAHGSLPT